MPSAWSSQCWLVDFVRNLQKVRNIGTISEIMPCQLGKWLPCSFVSPEAIDSPSAHRNLVVIFFDYGWVQRSVSFILARWPKLRRITWFYWIPKQVSNPWVYFNWTVWTTFHNSFLARLCGLVRCKVESRSFDLHVLVKTTAYKWKCMRHTWSHHAYGVIEYMIWMI